MHSVCTRLYSLGLQIEDISNLKERHIEELVRSWHESGIKPKTMENYISVIRRYCEWMGKGNMIPRSYALQKYLPEVDKAELKVRTYAIESKSWTENGVDVAQMILNADDLDVRFGAMLRLGLAFGLRRKEQLRCIPSRMDGAIWF